MSSLIRQPCPGILGPSGPSTWYGSIGTALLVAGAKMKCVSCCGGRGEGYVVSLDG